MGICVDCKKPARKKCHCGRVYCSYCRAENVKNKVPRPGVCSVCRSQPRVRQSQQAARQQASQQAASVTASGTYVPPSHLQAYANPPQVNTNANTPGGAFAFVSLPPPPIQDPLYLMDKPEFQHCIDGMVSELEEALANHQAYVNRRNSNTPTDIIYRKEIAALQHVIIRLRDEVPILYDMANTGQAVQQRRRSGTAHHGLTDMIAGYDTHFMGKPKP